MEESHAKSDSVWVPQSVQQMLKSSFYYVLSIMPDLKKKKPVQIYTFYKYSKEKYLASIIGQTA